MNTLRLILYIPRLAWYVLRVVLFRAYLLLFFVARPAGPVLAPVLIGLALILSWPFAGPLIHTVLAPWLDPLLVWAGRQPPGDGLRDLIELFAPLRTELATGLLVTALYWPLSWLQWVLLFILPAFPFPRRPLPPLWVWIPPKHRIERVMARITVPKHPLRYWDGDHAALARRLRPELQALLTPQPDLLPSPALELSVAPQEIVGAGEETPERPAVQREPAKKVVARPGAKRRPSAPWVPPAPHAAE